MTPYQPTAAYPSPPTAEPENRAAEPDPSAMTGADNVAYVRSADDGPTAAADAPIAAGNGRGPQRQTVPDRHQLPPSALAPAQFEMSYGTPAAADDGMCSRENLLAPRGQYLPLT